MTIPFGTFIDRRDSDSLKWNLFEEDVLPLWVADTDFQAPPPVTAALQKRLDHGLFGYSLPQESTKLSICEWLERRHHWTVSPEEVLLFPGVVPAFNIAARAYTNPGDSVLIQTPAYHPFFDLPTNVGLGQSEHSLVQDSSGKYVIDLDEFEGCIRPQTRIFMLCNPHNPTGRVFKQAELESIAEICLNRNIIICSDEIHSDLVYAPHQHLPIASISHEISQAAITLISPSKTFNLAGLKCSAVIIQNKRLREAFCSQTRGYAGSVNVLGETAMRAAYSQCEEWLADLLKYLDENRQALFQFVNQELPGVSMALPEGTYLGWLDFTKTDLDDPGDFLLQKSRVGLNSGSWFGSDYSKYARINFGCPAKILGEALIRIKSALIST
jgi:cystathionine beta-lyase